MYSPESLLDEHGQHREEPTFTIAGGEPGQLSPRPPDGERLHRRGQRGIIVCKLVSA